MLDIITSDLPLCIIATVCGMELFAGKYSSGEYILARDISDVNEAWEYADKCRNELVAKWRHIWKNNSGIKRLRADLACVYGIVANYFAALIWSTIMVMPSAAYLGLVCYAVNDLIEHIIENIVNAM